MIKDNDDQNKPVDALLSIERHQRLMGNTEDVVDLLAMPDGGDIELEVPTLPSQLFNAADLP